jgi:hypothetical protein
MPYLLVRHKVSDFSKWKPAYDAHLPALTTFARLAEIHLTITDFGMPTEFAEAFTKRGIRFQIVNLEQAPEDRKPMAEAI